MIAWWVWLLIWGGLVLGLLTMLAGFAWWLLRKGLVVLADLSELSARTALLDVPEREQAQSELAILTTRDQVRTREDARRVHRERMRREAHERRLERARRITRVDANAQSWPTEWHSAQRSDRGVH